MYSIARGARFQVPKIHTVTSRTTAICCSVHTQRLAHMSICFPFVDTSQVFSCGPTVRVKKLHMTVVLCCRTRARDGKRYLFGRVLRCHLLGHDIHADAEHRHLECNELRSTAEPRCGGTRSPEHYPAHLLRHEATFVGPAAPIAGLLKPSVRRPWDSEPRSLRSFRASAPAVAVTLVQQRSTRCDLGPSLPYTIVINSTVDGAAVSAAALTMRIAGSKALLEITGGGWDASVGGNNTRERTTFAVGS